MHFLVTTQHHVWVTGVGSRGRKCAMINVMPPGIRQQFMYGGRGANDLFLLVCRWCDKSPTTVAILRAAWPVSADPPDLALRAETGRHHPEGDALCIFLA